MDTPLDPLDQQLIALLKVNARLPVVKLAKSLGCARSTVQLRLKALEDRGVIAGYTLALARPHSAPRIHAIVLISIGVYVVSGGPWPGSMRVRNGSSG